MTSCVFILAQKGDATSFMMCFMRVWEASQQAESTGVYTCALLARGVGKIGMRYTAQNKCVE